MKKDQMKTLKMKQEADLRKMVSDKKGELGKLAVGIKSSSEKNLKKAKNLRLEIAQTLTILREKEIIRKESESKK